MPRHPPQLPSTFSSRPAPAERWEVLPALGPLAVLLAAVLGAAISLRTPQIAGKLFSDAGIRDESESLLSVEDAPAWKPARGSYQNAAASTGTDPGSMLLVAVHPWDIHGAARAGLRTAWLNSGAG